MKELIKQRDEAEAEYIKTGFAEAWADYLNYSIKVAEMERRN